MQKHTCGEVSEILDDSTTLVYFTQQHKLMQCTYTLLIYADVYMFPLFTVKCVRKFGSALGAEVTYIACVYTYMACQRRALCMFCTC